LRLAEIWSECLMDPARAVAALRELLRDSPRDREGHYRLAQEQYLLGRFNDAQRTVEKLIEIAAAPEDTAPPTELARYYYYLGRTLEAQGDVPGAASCYRRASEYDPAFAPTALALAKRAALAGDRHAAEAHLLAAARAAQERDPRAALTLHRGLAQVHLASGDREAAISEYRAIIAQTRESSDDRVALAEIYAGEKADLPKAIEELHRVLEQDLRHAPTYRLLVALYDKQGERDRAGRVLAILDMLGYAEDVERAYLSSLRTRQAIGPKLSQLSDVLRGQFLLPREAQGPLWDLFALVRDRLAQLHPMEYVGESAAPAGDGAVTAVAQDLRRVFGVDAQVMVADGVPRGVLAAHLKQPVAVLDRSFLERPEPELRFAVGRAFEALRGGYGPLLRLADAERKRWGAMLVQLLRPESERDAATLEFVKSLPRKSQRALEKLPPAEACDPAAWMAALEVAADRAGLLACDDVAAASRVLLRIGGGDRLEDSGAVALGAVPGGAELVRYYLGEDYQRLRAALSP
jgi:tetratricopeptide (TPR) repeat protein